MAAFTSGGTGLTCTFTDGSTDDGTIATRSWSFGDGGTSTQTSPSHPYAVAGTYAVTLTVTDDKGATGTVSKTVSPTAAASGVGSITSRSSGKCLAVQGASHTNATPVVLATCLNSSEQQWKNPGQRVRQVRSRSTMRRRASMPRALRGTMGTKSSSGPAKVAWGCRAPIKPGRIPQPGLSPG